MEDDDLAFLAAGALLWKYRSIVLFFLGLGIGYLFGNGTWTVNDLTDPVAAVQEAAIEFQELLPF